MLKKIYEIVARTGEKFLVDKDVYNFFKDKEVVSLKGYPVARLHQMFFKERKDGDITDHINNNTLDNRRDNLRLVTSLQNSVNRAPNKKNKTCYKGVRIKKRKNKEIIYISLKEPRDKEGSRKPLFRYEGFKTSQEAAIAYDVCALFLWGKYAYTNFDKINYEKLDLNKEVEKYRVGFKLKNRVSLRKTQFRGVRVVGKKFDSRYKKEYLGIFNCAEDAAIAYNNALIRDKGDIRKINVLSIIGKEHVI